MSFVRRAIPFFIAALAFAAPGQAATKPNPEPPPAPTGLHGFLLKVDEDPKRDLFPRTPSFAWSPVAGVMKYEFELSTSARFIESGQVWAGEVAGTPAVSIPIALPWMTGKPYALYARVRTVTTTGRSAWSDPPFGFNMEATRAPVAEDLKYSYPGLVRWKPVEGATSYEVWWLDLSKRISTLTNSADEREYYMFRQLSNEVHWRVRAVRTVYSSLPSGLPAVGYGAWSGTYTSINPTFWPFPSFPVEWNLSTTVSADVHAHSEASTPHRQTPAFLFGNKTLADLDHGFLYPDVKLYRVYVFTDRDCVNLVFRGAIVGSPAYSPRTSGSLHLPHGFLPPPTFDPSTLKTTPIYLRDALRDGDEGLTQMADLTTVVSSEVKKSSSSPSSGSSSEEPPTTPPTTPPATPPTEETPSSTSFTLPEPEGALVDLWDSGWPTGRYYWTVVPVNLVYDYPDAKSLTRQWIYRDTWVPQETCAGGLTGEFGNEFGKESDPVLISEGSGTPAPYVSGLTTDGKIEPAKQEKPVFYGTPLAAWKPAMGAAAYEVQWSKSKYPWSSEGTVFTFGTSALLQDKGKTLAPGEWFYRVRGLDPFVSSPIKAMSWSDPVPIVVAKPTFKVLKGTPEQKKTKEEKKLTFRTYPESGFAVAVPAQWKKIKANPFVKFYLAKGALNGLSTGETSLRFMAHDPTDKGRTTGVSVSYIPTVQQGQQQYGHDTWVKAVKATVAKQKRLVGKPYCVESSLPTGPALKCSYSFRVANSSVVESEISYWFDTPGKTWVLALSNPRSAAKAKASLRLSIAKKFKVTF